MLPVFGDVGNCGFLLPIIASLFLCSLFFVVAVLRNVLRPQRGNAQAGNFRCLDTKEEERVFSFENCSDLLWEVIVLMIENSRLKAENFAKFLGSLLQFIQTVKGQNNFWIRILVTGGSYWSNTLKWLKRQLEQIIGM